MRCAEPTRAPSPTWRRPDSRVNPKVEALKALLLPFGCSDTELADRAVDDLLEMIEREMQRLQA